MLKLVLEPGDHLDRSAEAASRQLSKLSEASIERGYVRVRAYPRPDALLASVAALLHFYSLGVRPVFRVSVHPPSRIDVPTLVLGYNSLNYKSSDVDDLLVAVSQDIAAPPPPGAVYVTGRGSVAGLLGYTMLAAGRSMARREIVYTLVAGLYAGPFVERTGRFHGVDKVFIEAVPERSGVGVEYVTGLKAYEPSRLPVCDAISSTIDPYYPDLTGDPRFCRDLLESKGVGELAERLLSSLSEGELEKLALAILEHIRDRKGDAVEASDYIGSIAVAPPPESTDLRMLSHALLYVADAVHSDHVAVEAASYFDYHVAAYTRVLKHSSRTLPRLVEEARPVRMRVQSWIRGYKVDVPEGVSPLFLWRALRMVGAVDDSPLLFSRGDKLCMSALQLEESLGYGEARKLVDVKAAVEEGLLLCTAENARP